MVNGVFLDNEVLTEGSVLLSEPSLAPHLPPLISSECVCTHQCKAGSVENCTRIQALSWIILTIFNHCKWKADNNYNNHTFKGLSFLFIKSSIYSTIIYLLHYKHYDCFLTCWVVRSHWVLMKWSLFCVNTGTSYSCTMTGSFLSSISFRWMVFDSSVKENDTAQINGERCVSLTLKFQQQIQGKQTAMHANSIMNTNG